MENYEILKKIDEYKERLSELEKAISLDKLSTEITNIEEEMSNPNFYNDMVIAQKKLKQVKENKKIIDDYKMLNDLLEELEMYFEMHKNLEAELMTEITDTIKHIDTKLSEFEIQMLLSKEYDGFPAIIELHPGAGGTESQDWTEMLFRMYKRYAEKHNFTFEVLDYLDGEEAGIKSVTFMVTGLKAYGYLKSEHGVHRLIRISPFDSNARRHTSFCACTVIPAVDADLKITINPDDIRVDTYRSSGAGGQHVNKTDSAIRITHLKTGIVVTCQNERSQLQNRESAMTILKSKLYQLELEEQEKKIKAASGAISQNSFGSQIRTYTFHPYSMVKDARTGYEEFNTNSVMDGGIDGFINAYLKSSYNVR